LIPTLKGRVLVPQRSLPDGGFSLAPAPGTTPCAAAGRF